QDFRPLSHDEAWLRRKLKCSYLGLASLERSIARQRVRLAWLRGDDVAVSYLNIHASHRKQRTAITSLQVGAQTVTSHDAMAEAAVSHFSGVLGTAEAREFSIDQSILRQYTSPLDDLDEPFSEEEIWRAVQCLPSGKAPGPDGFTTEFLRASWDIIKQDIYDAFNKFYTANGRGFQKLNEALLTLLPKRADAAALSDYRPISLI
uniref:Reverse transcriptase domain-containing protein n=3 Tax=Aegilops tauschii subsp. strangulata TaxID=200361 RepID=A0A453K6S6_AEGTS